LYDPIGYDVKWVVINRGYIAPEIMRDEKYILLYTYLWLLLFSFLRFSFPSDIYSLGVVAYQLASGGVDEKGRE
jgi:serine/threonine protein kinase